MLAVDRAADLLLSGEVERMVFARPAVEAGERLGTLPGGVREKLDQFLRPLFDELASKLGGGPLAVAQINRWVEGGVLEIVPIGNMRGGTFKNAAIVADEMQNATYSQFKMVLTRLGEGSHMFVTGDPEQSDIGGSSGLDRAASLLEENGYPVVYLGRKDVQRDPIVADILRFL
jgi:phosphate starvation-inducible PhoH-like protein